MVNFPPDTEGTRRAAHIAAALTGIPADMIRDVAIEQDGDVVWLDIQARRVSITHEDASRIMTAALDTPVVVERA